MRYYGGAEGNVLVYHPTLGLTSVLKQRLTSQDDKENVGEENAPEADDSGNGDGDGVTINLPPPGTLRFYAIYCRLVLCETSFNLRECKTKPMPVICRGGL
jgi:hypothetical protein